MKTRPGVILPAVVWLGLGACTGAIGGVNGGDPDDLGGGDGGGGNAQAGSEPGALGGQAGPSACETLTSPLDLATPARVWRLTATQYTNTVAALFGGSPPAYENPFAGIKSQTRFSAEAVGLGLPVATSEVVVKAAEVLAPALAGRLLAAFPCAASRSDACITSVINKIAPEAFRRPLQAAETQALVSLYKALPAGLTPRRALEFTLQGILSAPQFLFRTELGDGAVDADGITRLTADEVASLLAYSLTDGPPDQALREAARNNTLGTPDEIAGQVRRLLGADSGKASVLRFFREYFTYTKAADAFKDLKRYPDYAPASLVEDTNAFVKERLDNVGDGFYEDLLTSPEGFASAKSASTYGLTGVTATVSEKMAFPSGERSGILTQPSFLVTYSIATENQPIQRGKFISENLLCRGVPPLPIDVIPDLPHLPDSTLRERLSMHSEQPQCSVCHTLMDPLGFAFEEYDHLGRHRTEEENGRTVDTTGVLEDAGASDGPFAGALELSRRLADSPVVKQCAMRFGMQFWAGRQVLDADGCAIENASRVMRDTEGNVLESFAMLLGTQSLYRRFAN